MAAQNEAGLKRRVPVVTVIITAAATVVFLVPNLQPPLVYDRTAIFNGELWRLATGPWVHFSTRHFLYDTLVFGFAGWIIERRAFPNFG